MYTNWLSEIGCVIAKLYVAHRRMLGILYRVSVKSTVTEVVSQPPGTLGHTVYLTSHNPVGCLENESTNFHDKSMFLRSGERVTFKDILESVKPAGMYD